MEKSCNSNKHTRYKDLIVATHNWRESTNTLSVTVLVNVFFFFYFLLYRTCKVTEGRLAASRRKKKWTARKKEKNKKESGACCTISGCRVGYENMFDQDFSLLLEKMWILKSRLRMYKVFFWRRQKMSMDEYNTNLRNWLFFCKWRE